MAFYLGIEDNPELDPIDHAKPLTSVKQTSLYNYILEHEAQEAELFSNSDGIPFLPVNRSLVFLQRGAGFGELALMSNTVRRMTTCRADTYCSLGTLSRPNFAAILKRASLRKISQ